MKRAGFMTMDALAGLFLLAALATALVIAGHSQQRAAASLHSQRCALLAAQQAIQDLQAGRAAAEPTIVKRTGLRAGNMEWVEVTAFCDARRISLVGLAPALDQSK